MTRLLALLTVAAVAMPAGTANAGIVERSFTIAAEAFPMAPAPGQQQTELSVRPAGTRAAVSNAPATAYARGAVVDSGAIELFTGPPPEESVAECDTGSTNVPDESTARPGSSRLTASCNDRPMGQATAAGQSSGDDTTAAGSFASAVRADGGGDAAVGEATAEMHDATYGPLSFASARYEAEASASGTPGGAEARGRITMSGATIGGVPVVVGPKGVRVDEEEVPTELVPAAAAAVNTALTQGGYSTVRLVQPETTAAADGSSASVRGGGVFVELADPDPKSRRFARMTFVGGRIEVNVGPTLRQSAGPTAPPAAPPAPAPSPEPGPIRADPGAATPPAPAATSDGAGDGASEVAVAGEVVVARSERQLPQWWSGWVWCIVAVVATGGLGAASRRRLADAWERLADRFLRG